MHNQDLFHFIIERAPELAQRTSEHLMLASVSTFVATILGIIIAIAAFEYRKMRDPITTVVGILQTVPSLALLVFLMTVMGRIGVLPALTALTLYALLPIVRNTLIGLESAPDSIVEAAKGIGMTKGQEIYLVRIPIAVPAIVSGVRTAAVVGVGIATLGAFIGAGGLGEFINRGLALSDPRLILMGAIPSAMLAILADGVLAVAEWGIKPVQAKATSLGSLRQGMRRQTAAYLPLTICLASLIFYLVEHPITDQSNVIRIGSKHFTEQLILGELLAQSIEARTKLKVERRFDLGGTLVCHGALMKGEIDLYPEYTGTSLSTVLKVDDIHDPLQALYKVSREYKTRFSVTWLSPFGFNNSWALLVNSAAARANRWRDISDLKGSAANLRLGLTEEFAERSDGYPGLKKAYGLNFRHVSDINTNLAYKALAENELDVAAGNTTDGRIHAYKLISLNDDLRFFMPYQAAPIIRDDVLQRHPEIASVSDSLAGQIDDSSMQNLNYKVDGEHQSPASVVHQFLLSKHLIGKASSAPQATAR